MIQPLGPARPPCPRLVQANPKTSIRHRLREKLAIGVDWARHCRPNLLLDMWITSGVALVRRAAAAMDWTAEPGRWTRRGPRRLAVIHPLFGQLEISIKERRP